MAENPGTGWLAGARLNEVSRADDALAEARKGRHKAQEAEARAEAAL